MSARFPLYILAGGQSRRFGSDKARAILDGRPLIRRLADQLRPITASIHAVADLPDKYADLDLPTIADRTPGQGPLGGLRTALEHLAARNLGDWLLLIACDWVEIRPDWIDRLTAAGRDMPQARAVAFKDTRWQPVPALYHLDLLPLIERQLDSGERSMQSLLTRARSLPLPLPPDWPAVPQINTPQQYHEATRNKE